MLFNFYQNIAKRLGNYIPVIEIKIWKGSFIVPIFFQNQKYFGQYWLSGIWKEVVHSYSLLK